MSDATIDDNQSTSAGLTIHVIDDVDDDNENVDDGA